MADSRKLIEAYKGTASSYQEKLQKAGTKDEALSSAISAVENLMEALKITSDPAERQELRLECTKIMEAADRIKKLEHLSTPASPPDDHLLNGGLGQWAADAAKSGRASLSQDGSQSNTKGKYRRDVISSPSSPPPVVDTPEPSRAAITPLQSTTSKGPEVDGSKKPDLFASLISLSKRQFSRSDGYSTETAIAAHPNGHTRFADEAEATIANANSIKLTANPLPQPDAQGYLFEGQHSALLVPALASRSQIRRLREPISTRKRATKEEIILLKASVVNGFKCPPWDMNADSSEFALEEGSEGFKDVRDLSLSPYQQQFLEGWVRASKAIPPPSLHPNSRSGLGPLMSTSGSIDLVQDAATDCSVVASLCAGIARTERGHDQMLSNKISPYDRNLGKPVISPNGKYIVRLNFNGCWRKVVIDDRLPLSKTHRLLHVIDRGNPGLLWPALLEKAYLKVRGGYDFPGSNSCSDLWTLTGWVPEEIYLQETETVPAQLWKRIYNSFKYGDVLVTIGTGKMSTRQERELGLEGQHSYVVLDMRETDHDRLLLVKNPWVEGKGWRGPRSSAAPILNASILNASLSTGDTKNSMEAHNLDGVPSKDQPHPTKFWIGLDHVVQHFERLYLNWNPGLFKYRQDIHFDWIIKESKGAGNCIVNNPQFSFSSEEACVVWFLLSRHFRDMPEDAKVESDAFNDGSIRPETHMHSSEEALKGYMSIFVCNGNGQRIHIKDTYEECSPYVNTPQCLLRWKTDAKSKVTIVIDQDELPSSTYTFSLSAFCNAAISLEAASDIYSFQKMEVGAWTKQTAGGGIESHKYFENPQYILQVHEKCSLGILLASQDQANAVHMKLALGYGKRIYRLQSRDVLVDSGDHRFGSAFANIDDIQPGLYTIICSLFEAGKTGEYTLRVDSTNEVELKPIPRDGAGLLSLPLVCACFGPDIHRVAAPLVPHRLARITIIARFQKATSPRSHTRRKVARSPFRLSVELGTGPDRQFITTSEGGQYTDAIVVRCEAFDLDPELLTHGDLWLVLDRLSGPRGPVEEWYEVEFLMDMPKACSVGVWRTRDD